MTAYLDPRGKTKGGRHDWTDTADRIADLQHQYAAKVRDLMAMQSEIERAIDAQDDARIRTVMRDRYINGKEYLQIAGRMNYSIDSIFRLHAAGVKDIEATAQYHAACL